MDVCSSLLHDLVVLSALPAQARRSALTFRLPDLRVFYAGPSTGSAAYTVTASDETIIHYLA